MGPARRVASGCATTGRRRTIPILPSRVTVEGLDRAPHRAKPRPSLNPLVHARALVEINPAVKLISLPNVGHLPQQEAPERLLEALHSAIA